MLVYGDKSFVIPFGKMLKFLAERIAHLADSNCNLDSIRSLLIQAGQLEQAIEDAADGDSNIPAALPANTRALVESVARLFLEAFSNPAEGHPFAKDNVRKAWNTLTHSSSSKELHNLTLKTKVPEGFEYYALYPEQYHPAAKIWLSGYPTKNGEILVIGLRSIGTTLSAIVQATLQAEGKITQRITVRPSGDPYTRKTLLAPETLSNISHAIIVDEGPGASGSSMASVAESLIAHDLPLEQITFFPGHGGMPGPAANDRTREIWSSVKRIAPPLETLRWQDEQGAERSLGETLLSRTNNSASSPFHQIQTLGPGEWRRRVFASESEWPAVTAAFERLKFLCESPSEKPVLWKFEGLGSLLNADCASSLPFSTQIAAAPTAIKPFAHHLGFAATVWESGRHLDAADAANPTILQSLATYLIQSKGPQLSTPTAAEQFEVLRNMAYWNLHKSVGPESAEKLNFLASTITPQPAATYSDGRMAPYEWLLDANGNLRKTVAFGHIHDHTLIGTQSWLWDIAGIIVEWKLNGKQEENLLQLLATPTEKINRTELHFYKIAYAIFRFAIFEFSPGWNEAESIRVTQAREYYKSLFSHLLSSS